MPPATHTPDRTLAIVGGGASGTLLAVHLLRRAREGTRIVLIERRGPAGPGVAYHTDCRAHRLNVPAGGMSLFADKPGDFVDWMGRHAGFVGFPERIDPADHVARSLYGAYISDTLEAARAAAPAGVELSTISGEVVDIEENGPVRRLFLADGRSMTAQAVVLAIGNLPGEYPIRRPMPFYRGPRYVHVPWLASLLANISRSDDVLVVGAGPTAVDIIVQLDSLGHRGTIHALSRRGLRPLGQVPGLPPLRLFPEGARLPGTTREALHLVRSETRRAAAHGGDWRSVIDAIRPHTQAIWAGFPPAERARFMRHVRPFWDAHRHRISPETAETVARLEAAGRVRFSAGRLESLRDTPTGAEAIYRLRGTDRLVTLQVAKVINCTGPRTDYSKYQHPLLINLLARGLIDHDPLALGINALPTLEVLRYRGGPTGWLFTLGPPLKGMLWESTAIAEIRVQAKALAESLLERF
jgi:uncharacterized NAD(P)/FAD-binding protein YdhS